MYKKFMIKTYTKITITYVKNYEYSRLSGYIRGKHKCMVGKRLIYRILFLAIENYKSEC